MSLLREGFLFEGGVVVINPSGLAVTWDDDLFYARIDSSGEVSLLSSRDFPPRRTRNLVEPKRTSSPSTRKPPLELRVKWWTLFWRPCYPGTKCPLGFTDSEEVATKSIWLLFHTSTRTSWRYGRDVLGFTSVTGVWHPSWVSARVWSSYSGWTLWLELVLGVSASPSVDPFLKSSLDGCLELSLLVLCQTPVW